MHALPVFSCTFSSSPLHPPAGPALAKALPAGALLIPNCEGGYGCQDGNGSSRIPGYTGVMEEFFGDIGQLPNATSGENGKTAGDLEGIASLVKLAQKGTLLLFFRSFVVNIMVFCLFTCCVWFLSRKVLIRTMLCIWVHTCSTVNTPCMRPSVVPALQPFAPIIIL
jgi:hypothetical protein